MDTCVATMTTRTRGRLSLQNKDDCERSDYDAAHRRQELVSDVRFDQSRQNRKAGWLVSTHLPIKKALREQQESSASLPLRVSKSDKRRPT